MNLIRISEPRAFTPNLEPFRMMRNMLRWDPFREMEGYPRDWEVAFAPPFDVKESASGYVLCADLPGVRLEDLEINLTGSVLSVSGKREAEARQEGETFYLTERTSGAFSRTFTLPEGLDGANVQAELKDGVLRIHVPKTPEVQPRKITIRASN